MYDKAIDGIMDKLICRKNGLTYVAGKPVSWNYLLKLFLTSSLIHRIEEWENRSQNGESIFNTYAHFHCHENMLNTTYLRQGPFIMFSWR